MTDEGTSVSNIPPRCTLCTNARKAERKCLREKLTEGTAVRSCFHFFLRDENVLRPVSARTYPTRRSLYFLMRVKIKLSAVYARTLSSCVARAT